jgi:ABC-type multidrug transport system ATPase subunit
MYSRASTILLDDVISAVDAQTSQHIIKHCFTSPLMAGRTVIIASHAVELLAPLACQALFLDAGKVVWTGTGPDLLESEHMAHLKTEAPALLKEEEEDNNVPTIGTLRKRRQSEKLSSMSADFELNTGVARTPRQLLMEEQRAKGTIDMQHWKDLITSNGGKMFWSGLMVLLFVTCLSPVAERKALE